MTHRKLYFISDRYGGNVEEGEDQYRSIALMSTIGKMAIRDRSVNINTRTISWKEPILPTSVFLFSFSFFIL